MVIEVLLRGTGHQTPKGIHAKYLSPTGKHHCRVSGPKGGPVLCNVMSFSGGLTIQCRMAAVVLYWLECLFIYPFYFDYVRLGFM